MKRILVMLTLLLSIGLVACGGGDETEDTTPEADAAPTEALGVPDEGDAGDAEEGDAEGDDAEDEEDDAEDAEEDDAEADADGDESMVTEEAAS